MSHCNQDFLLQGRTVAADVKGCRVNLLNCEMYVKVSHVFLLQLYANNVLNTYIYQGARWHSG